MTLFPSEVPRFDRNAAGAAWMGAMPRHVALSVAGLDLSLATGHSLPELPTLLNRTVLTGGKKLRPALCFLMGDVLGIPAATLAPYARIAELLHCATLVHDDVIDGSTQRRRRPTLNASASNARAVLAGDLLLARVIVEVSDLGEVAVIRALSEALESLVNGEWRQMGARGSETVDREHLTAVARDKTASLMSWCCLVPAHLARLPEERKNACIRLGELIGLAFQMKDDLIDFEPNGEKPYAQDIRDGLINFLARELLDLYPELAEPVRDVLGVAEPAAWPWSEAQLDRARKRLDGRIAETLGAASDTLEGILREAPGAHTESADALRGMIAFLGVRRT